MPARRGMAGTGSWLPALARLGKTASCAYGEAGDAVDAADEARDPVDTLQRPHVHHGCTSSRTASAGGRQGAGEGVASDEAALRGCLREIAEASLVGLQPCARHAVPRRVGRCEPQAACRGWVHHEALVIECLHAADAGEVRSMSLMLIRPTKRPTILAPHSEHRAAPTVERLRRRIRRRPEPHQSRTDTEEVIAHEIAAAQLNLPTRSKSQPGICSSVSAWLGRRTWTRRAAAGAGRR